MMLAKIKTSLRKVIYSNGVNPLPTKIMFIVYMLNLFNSMVMTMVFSFLPRMVKSFGASEVQAGTYAGLLGSSLFISRTIFSVFWGYFSDYKGRKFSLLVAVGGLMATTLAFGFSTNFYWAVATRMLQGAFMGIIIITKAILADACDDTNFTLGLSILISSFSAGLIIGPSVAGFLVFPAEQYPGVFSKDGLFGRFSVLLPMLVLFIGFFIPFVLSIIYLPSDRTEKEELTRLLPSPASKHEQKASYEALESSGGKIEHTLSEKRLYGDQGDSFMVISINKNRFEKANTRQKASSTWFHLFNKIDDCDVTKENTARFSLKKLNESKISRVIKIKECMMTCLLYGLFSFVGVGQSELFPLFAATDTDLHGFGFSPAQIGLLLLIVSVFMIVVQLTFLPRFNDYFGSKKTLIICSCALAFLFPILPSTSGIKNSYLFWSVASFQLILTRTFVTLGFLAINVLLNNSVTSDLLGSANGFAMTIASIGRMIAPIVLGTIYSWSLKNVDGGKDALSFPFTQYFAFFVLSLSALLVALLASFLPKSMDQRREVENQDGSLAATNTTHEEYFDDRKWRRTDIALYEF